MAPWSLSQSRRRPRILVVDDDADVRESVAEMLAERGWSTETAVDGQDAIEQLLASRAPPDLIVLDLKMPRRSGWEVLDVLRRSTTLTQVPIVVLSAYLAFPPQGAVAWLRKPVNPEELAQTVTRLAQDPSRPS